MSAIWFKPHCVNLNFSLWHVISKWKFQVIDLGGGMMFFLINESSWQNMYVLNTIQDQYRFAFILSNLGHQIFIPHTGMSKGGPLVQCLFLTICCFHQWGSIRTDYTEHMDFTASQTTRNFTVYSNVFFIQHQGKHQSSRHWHLVKGIQKWPVDSCHERTVTRKASPYLTCHDVIMRNVVQISAHCYRGFVFYSGSELGNFIHL